MGHRKIKRRQEEVESKEQIVSLDKKVILPIHGSFSKIHERFLEQRGRNDARRYKARG